MLHFYLKYRKSCFFLNLIFGSNFLAYYFTKANISEIKKIGFPGEIMNLDNGIKYYLKEYTLIKY